MILVTGAAGFIGSHLCASLLEQGKIVVGMDNFCTGSPENLAAFQDNKNFSFLEHDITEQLPALRGINQMYNLACPASPADYLALPLETLNAGSEGMRNVLLFAHKNKARVLQASTSEVYGDPLEHPQTEHYWGNVNPVGVRSCYDESKRFAEALVMGFHRVHKVDTRIVRIFNTYGPGMRHDDGRVVSNFIVQALAGKPLTVYGDGSQTRSFCYVSDLVSGLQKAMHATYSSPVNLGNPTEFTVKQLAERVLMHINSSSRIVFKPLPEDDPVQRKPDITLAQKKLGWWPGVSLDEGLEKTIAWFRQHG